MMTTIESPTMAPWVRMLLIAVRRCCITLATEIKAIIDAEKERENV